MVLALGVDGGGTQTRCVVINERGELLGIGISGASKPDAVELQRGIVNLHEAILTATKDCGGPAAIDSVFMGMGGIASSDDIEVIRGMLNGLELSPTTPIGIDYDVHIALAGGTAGQPGIALIVGTGSSCYGRNAAGESWRSGGWGYIIDDFGSGFYLGQQAIMAVIRAFDGRAPQTALTPAVLQSLGIDAVTDVMHRIYHPRLDITGIAGLAPSVVQVAENGDAVANAIIQHGCDELALMIESVTRKLSLPDDVVVIPVGSLGTINVFYRQALEAAVARRLPQAQVRKPIAEPVYGAALLALQQIGLTLDAETLARIDPL